MALSIPALTARPLDGPSVAGSSSSRAGGGSAAVSQRQRSPLCLRRPARRRAEGSIDPYADATAPGWRSEVPGSRPHSRFAPTDPPGDCGLPECSSGLSNVAASPGVLGEFGGDDGLPWHREAPQSSPCSRAISSTRSRSTRPKTLIRERGTALTPSRPIYAIRCVDLGKERSRSTATS